MRGIILISLVILLSSCSAIGIIDIMGNFNITSLTVPFEVTQESYNACADSSRCCFNVGTITPAFKNETKQYIQITGPATGVTCNGTDLTINLNFLNSISDISIPKIFSGQVLKISDTIFNAAEFQSRIYSDQNLNLLSPNVTLQLPSTANSSDYIKGNHLNVLTLSATSSLLLATISIIFAFMYF